jgi:hypothetical protein
MPRARRTPVEPTALQFKVTLNDIAPSIWREILLPPDASMWALHVAIQDAMGWNDSHLHAFGVESAAAGEPIVIGIPTDVDVELVIAGWEVPVALVFRAAGDRVVYDYDFGDGWTHSVVLETVVTTGKPLHKPVCSGGERACPPDDCGGVHGYEELLKALENPAHPEHREMKRWAPKNFDPERFDPKKVKFDDPAKRLRLAME